MSGKNEIKEMMTPTDEELIEWSAIILMGYTEYFIDPNGIGHCKDEKGEWISWNPLDKENGQIWDAVDRMRELGWFLNLFTGASVTNMWENNKPIASDCYAHFYRYPEGGNDSVQGPTIKDRNPATAITLAAKATEVKP